MLSDTIYVVSGARAVDVVHLAALSLPVGRDSIQVGVVDGKFGVVDVEYPSGRPLHRHLADWKALGLAVRGADDLDVVLRLFVAKLHLQRKRPRTLSETDQHHERERGDETHQDDCKVVHEQQGVHQVDGKRHQAFVRDDFGLVDQVRNVEQPERDDEDNNENADLRKGTPLSIGNIFLDSILIDVSPGLGTPGFSARWPDLVAKTPPRFQQLA